MSPLILAQTDTEADSEIHAHPSGKFSGASDEERINFAQLVNSSNMGWTADAYVDPSLQAAQVFAQTGSHSEHGNRPTKQGRPPKKPFADGSSEFKKALKHAQKFLKTPLD